MDNRLGVILLMFISGVVATCAFSSSTGRVVCTTQTQTATAPPSIVETNYADSPMHSVIIKTKITILGKATVSTVTNEPRYYKMSGVYVSESICLAYVGGCKDDIAVTIPINVTHKPTTCIPVTDKEWDAWCYQMLNTADKVDCKAFSSATTAQMRYIMRGC